MSKRTFQTRIFEGKQKERGFLLDERLKASSFYLVDWPLSQVFLKNNANYPWFILVPRRHGVREITDLCRNDRYQLMDEVHQLSVVLQETFKPDKINTGALGNIVAQLHLHVVGRYHDDALWPQGIWQAAAEDKPYVDPISFLQDLVVQLSSFTFR